MTAPHPPAARASLRALRLEQIAIWSAAADSEPTRCAASPGFGMYAERRASLFEETAASRGTPRSGLARRSLVRLGDAPARFRRAGANDPPARRSSVASSVSRASSDDDNPSKPPLLVSKEPEEKFRRRLFAGRAKSTAPAGPPSERRVFDSAPRAKSFFQERRTTDGAPTAARKSIRFLGRYARSGSARLPLFRPRGSAKTRDDGGR